MKFVRYGGLSSVRQKGYGITDSFHAPPARRGIYACPDRYVEYFLLGKNVFDPRRHKISENGSTLWRKEKYEKEFNELFDKYWLLNETAKTNEELAVIAELDKQIEYMRETYSVNVENSNKKVFDYNGKIWCHLDIPNHEIEKRVGSWVLVEHAVYKTYFKKEISKRKFTKMISGFGIDRDYLEVFIEKV